MIDVRRAEQQGQSELDWCVWNSWKQPTWTVLSSGGSSGVEELGVVFDVIAHEGVDEEEAVVVALQEETQRQGHMSEHIVHILDLQNNHHFVLTYMLYLTLQLTKWFIFIKK